jgi:uncharacterized metal-binding protein YceD (DUF177 family)
VAVEDIPDTGLHMEIEAPEVARAAVAQLAGLRELPQLAATFDLTCQAGGVHVSGQVNARVGQTCVVTLEPIENTMTETIDVKFAPGAAATKTSRKKKAQGEDDPPEPLIGGSLDLGALATEFLILGIDPYPRKPGAQFDTPESGKSEQPGDRPFAALAALKDRLGGGKP